MIRKSTAIAAVAVLLSLLAHVLGLGFSSRPPPEPSAGETGPGVVAMGNAFEDVAEAVSEPVLPEPAPVPDPAEEPLPEPETTDSPTSEALVASSDPQDVRTPDAASAKAVEPDRTEPAEPEESGSPEPETVEPSGGDAGGIAEAAVTPPIEPVGAVAAEPVPNPPVAAAPQQRAAVPAPAQPALTVTPAPEPSAIPVIPLAREVPDPEPPEATVGPVPETSETTETEEEADGSELAVVSSPRPQVPTRQPPTDPTGQREGSAEFSELLFPPLIESPLTAYRRDRTDLSVRSNSGTSSDGLGFSGSGGTGNSDVTNYAGRVLVHLNRAPKVPVSGRGFARVFFVINPDGTLATVSIIDSTGAQQIDRAAKAQVRAAAPFPPPPQGTRRQITFVYQIN